MQSNEVLLVKYWKVLSDLRSDRPVQQSTIDLLELGLEMLEDFERGKTWQQALDKWPDDVKEVGQVCKCRSCRMTRIVLKD